MAVRHWEQAATANAHGQFRAKAQRAGMGTLAYARKEDRAPGKLGKEARLAIELIASRKGGKR